MLTGLWIVVSLVAAEQRPVLAIVPPPGEGIAAAVFLRMQEAAEGIAELRLLHPKQIIAVADAVPKAPPIELARRLGATHVVFGQVNGNTLEVSFADRTKTLGTKSLPLDDAQVALDRAPALLEELAQAVTGKVPSVSEPAKGYLEYAACHRLLSRQPVSLRAPVVLDADGRAAAVKACTQAVALAPGLKQASAALGFARALINEKEEAEAALAAAKDDRLVPYYVVGKFWVLSRFYDGEQAALYLKEVVEKYPGFLLGRGYLGETLNALRRYDEALAVFEAYAAEVPQQPWVLAHVGYTFAKKKQYAEAIDWTKRALDLASDDDEIRMELASRFIDAGRVPEAQSMLEVLARSPDARGEVLLRLGYTHLAQGHLADAEKWVTLALDRAGKAREWRTRGRAFYDLAKISARRGAKPKAIDALEKAFAEGYKDTARLTQEKDFDPLRKDPRFVALLAKPKVGKIVLPTFASPFHHDPLSGDFHPTPLDPPKDPMQKKTLGVSF